MQRIRRPRALSVHLTPGLHQRAGRRHIADLRGGQWLAYLQPDRRGGIEQIARSGSLKGDQQSRYTLERFHEDPAIGSGIDDIER